MHIYLQGAGPDDDDDFGEFGGFEVSLCSHY